MLVAGFVFLQLGQQGLVVDLERMGRLGFVPTAGLKDTLDVRSLDFLEGTLRLLSCGDGGG